MNQGPYSPVGLPLLPRGSSSLSGNARAAEAELLSHASRTAMVAARSILIAGGSEEVALKTAKAAAESVLNPCNSDNDTIAGRGSSFLRRRRIKRQAEVVASMALTTAANNMRNEISADWSESNPGSQMNPYARNITTRSMNTQDEPSVLSGSTRPPLGSTIDPSQRHMHSMHSRMTTPSPQMFVLTEKVGSTNENPPSAPPLSPRLSSLSKYSVTQGKNTDSQIQNSQDEDIPTENINPSPNRPSMKHDIKPQLHQEKRTPPRAEPPIFNVDPGEKDENHGEDMTVSHLGPSVDDDEFDDETTVNDRSVWTTETRQNPWKDFDPLLTTVTTVFNMLTCTPLGPVDPQASRPEINRRGGVPLRITHDADFETVASAMDTLDDAETQTQMSGNGTEYRSMDSYDNTEAKDEIVGSNSSGDSSVDSCSFIRDLQSTSYSEGEINVRSTIRDTMEKVVAISKKGLKHGSPDENRKWTSYEGREAMKTSTSQANNIPTGKRNPIKVFVTPKATKKSFFFNKRATLKK